MRCTWKDSSSLKLVMRQLLPDKWCSLSWNVLLWMPKACKSHRQRILASLAVQKERGCFASVLDLITKFCFCNTRFLRKNIEPSTVKFLLRKHRNKRGMKDKEKNKDIFSLRRSELWVLQPENCLNVTFIGTQRKPVWMALRVKAL